MNQELSTTVSSAVILFFDESTKFITQDEYDGLLRALENSATKSVRLGKNIYYIGGIKKVLTMEEYYDEYPDQKPEKYNEVSKRDDKYTALQDRIPINGLPSLVKGLARYIHESEFDGTKRMKARALLEHYDKQAKI